MYKISGTFVYFIVVFSEVTAAQNCFLTGITLRFTTVDMAEFWLILCLSCAFHLFLNVDYEFSFTTWTASCRKFACRMFAEDDSRSMQDVWY